MGFFSSIGNFFSGVVKTVGKALATVAAVVAAPFTGGLSLATIPAIWGQGDKPIIKSVTYPNGPPPEPVKRFPIKEKPVEPTITHLDTVESSTGAGARTGVKQDVTLYGYYADINRVSIPIDNDVNNVVVVKDTYFPYIAVFDNHGPSDGKRYVSQFTWDTLMIAYNTNLDRVLYDLDKQNGNFPYITFDWSSYRDTYLAQSKGLGNDGGILYWSWTPEFVLQWLDGDTNQLSFPLEYAYVKPKGVKTIADLNADVDPGGIADKQGGDIVVDSKKKDRIANILSSIGAGVAYANLAVAAAGAIQSRFKNAAGAVKNLAKTASDLADKFGAVKGMLSKDAINGKIADLKSLINKKLPKIPSIKSFYQRQKAFLQEEITLLKKSLKRKPKDTKIRGKFGLKSVTAGLDKVSNSLDKVSKKIDKVTSSVPKIPPAALNLATKLANNGGKLDMGSLVGVGLPNLNLGALGGLVPNFSNVNWADPLSAVDSITAGINGVNDLGQRVLTSADNYIADKKAKGDAEKARYDKMITDFNTTAKESLQGYLKTIPVSAPLPRVPLILDTTVRNPTSVEAYNAPTNGTGTNSTTPKTGTTTTKTSLPKATITPSNAGIKGQDPSTSIMAVANQGKVIYTKGVGLTVSKVDSTYVSKPFNPLKFGG